MLRRIDPRWQPCPATIPADTCVVDVWRIGPASGSPLPLRQQAHQARAALLAAYAGIPDGEELWIEQRAKGKPFLAEPYSDIEFNLSHCADLALLAVSRALPLGIDVEGERDLPDSLRIARRVFDAQSLARLTAASASERNRLFIELWTRLEARQKAYGRGIFAAPVDASMVHSLSFRASRRHIACLSLTQAVADDAPRFYDYDAGALPAL